MWHIGTDYRTGSLGNGMEGTTYWTFAKLTEETKIAPYLLESCR